MLPSVQQTIRFTQAYPAILGVTSLQCTFLDPEEAELFLEKIGNPDEQQPLRSAPKP